MEIPLKLLEKPMLYSGRVAQISNNTDVIAGQMPSNPKMVGWSRDDIKVYLHAGYRQSIVPIQSHLSTLASRIIIYNQSSMRLR